MWIGLHTSGLAPNACRPSELAGTRQAQYFRVAEVEQCRTGACRSVALEKTPLTSRDGGDGTKTFLVGPMCSFANGSLNHQSEREMFCNNLTDAKSFFEPLFDQIQPNKDEFKTLLLRKRRFRIPASGSLKSLNKARCFIADFRQTP